MITLEHWQSATSPEEMDRYIESLPVVFHLESEEGRKNQRDLIATAVNARVDDMWWG